MPESSDPTIIFQHIPKAAGNTVLAALETRFERERMYLCGKDGVLNDFLALPQQRRDALKLLAGHVEYGIHERFSGPCKYFSFLREPVDRVVSHYHFIRNSPRHRYGDQARAMSMVEFVTAGIRPRMNNCMVRMFSGRDAEYGKCGDDMLDEALGNLRKSYFMLGSKEKFEESLRVLGGCLGFEPPTPENRNVSKNRPAVEELASDVVDLIKEYNQLDLRLYEMFRDRLPLSGSMHDGLGI